MADCGLEGMELPDWPQRLPEPGKLRPEAGNPNGVAELGQRAHGVTAEETRAAEDGDERFERNGGHARSRSSIAEYRIASIVYRTRAPNLTTTGALRTYPR